MNYLYAIYKFWREALIGLLAVAFGLLWLMQNQLVHKNQELQRQYNDYKQAQQYALIQSKAKADIQEQAWIKQLAQTEKDYNAKIQQIRSDATDTQSHANRLSAELALNKKRLSQASQAAREHYSATLSDVFEQCVAEYTKVAKDADEYSTAWQAINNAWPVEN